MPRSTLPTIPLVVFGIIEPILLVIAYITAMSNPRQYFADQSPSFAVAQNQWTPQALGMTLQMANVLLLLAPLAVVACWSRDANTARGFLFCVALADFGHIYATYAAVGPAIFWDYRGWNGAVGGNIAGSAVLNVLRWMTLFGVLGKVEDGEGVVVAKDLKKRA
ncbi:hypothetical protein B0H63DRAFT_102789 [Podospora didyma]|uniref:DUF7704 domain-containing protein n=1 Tax=Podospora didyma TaxID=330526 RepID=A0AAE0NXV9_9PEZI|nr:hypothetical protein B0H63DRAFT_102789 [Podospora didyma]